MGNMTCFELIRSLQARLLTRRQESREKSQISYWMNSRTVGWVVTSTKPSVRLWRNWIFQKKIFCLLYTIEWIFLNSWIITFELTPISWHWLKRLLKHPQQNQQVNPWNKRRLVAFVEDNFLCIVLVLLSSLWVLFNECIWCIQGASN